MKNKVLIRAGATLAAMETVITILEDPLAEWNIPALKAAILKLDASLNEFESTVWEYAEERNAI